MATYVVTNKTAHSIVLPAPFGGELGPRADRTFTNVPSDMVEASAEIAQACSTRTLEIQRVDAVASLPPTAPTNGVDLVAALKPFKLELDTLNQRFNAYEGKLEAFVKTAVDDRVAPLEKEMRSTFTRLESQLNELKEQLTTFNATLESLKGDAA